MTFKERYKIVETPANWAKINYYGNYKTAIIGSELYLHFVVTRVNYLTATLWLDWRASKIKGHDGFLALPSKPNWLVMLKKFREEETQRVLALNNQK